MFFALREFTLELEGTEERLLPLTPRIASVATEDLVPTSTSQNSSQSNADIIHLYIMCVHCSSKMIILKYMYTCISTNKS